MHDHYLRPDVEPCARLGSGSQGLRAAGRGVLCGALHNAFRATLVALLALFAAVAWADAYTEVNEKISSGQWQAAQTLIERHLQKEPADPQMRLMQSQVQTAQGQTALAIDTLQALTQEFPELPEPYNNLAVLYASQQRFDDAMTALKQAVRARPDYGLALENLGDVYIALARQAYLQAKRLPQGPLVGLRLDTKIERTEQLLQPVKP